MRVNMGGRLQSLRLTLGEDREAEERLGHFLYAEHGMFSNVAAISNV